MAITLFLKGKKPGSLLSGAKRKPSAGKKPAGKKKPGGRRSVVHTLGASAIKQRLAKGRMRHKSLSKSTRPALPAETYRKARRYFYSSRRTRPKLRFYDKVRAKSYREWKKAHGGKAMYQARYGAGRRPRQHKRIKYGTGGKSK